MTTKLKIDSKSLKFKVRIVIEKDDPGYHAYAPSLPGLHMPGDTQKEALENAKEAAALMLKVMIEDGESIPIDVIVPPKEHNKARLSNQAISSLEEIQVKL
jgi:predicted RNase H-like HicB family nuclease